MTIPMEYAHAQEAFDRFMDDFKSELGHETRHQTYQTVESVLRTFRRRLDVTEALAFADALPAILRAIFVADWRVSEPTAPFAALAAMNREVHAYRINHDFSPGDAIERMAKVLARHVDRLAFEAALARLPQGARDFWTVMPTGFA